MRMLRWMSGATELDRTRTEGVRGTTLEIYKCDGKMRRGRPNRRSLGAVQCEGRSRSGKCEVSGEEVCNGPSGMTWRIGPRPYNH